MFDKVYNATANIANSAEIFKAFSDLTIGRSENRGILKVTQDGNGVYTLKCANHHFLSARNKFEDNQTNAQNLRELLERAVFGELDAAMNALPSESRLDKVAVLQKIKNEFQKAINGNEGQSLTRKAIGAILQNVNMLKQNLSVDTLLAMQPSELATLADNGGDTCKFRAVEGLKQRTERNKVALQNLKYNLNLCTSSGQILKPCKKFVSELYANVKAELGKPDDTTYSTMNFLVRAQMHLKNPKKYWGCDIREIRGVIARTLEDAKKGPVIGLTDERKLEFEHCLNEIKQHEKAKTDSREWSELAGKLLALLQDYQEYLENNLPEAFNQMLEKIGIKRLHLDENGDVAIKSKESDKDLAAMAVKNEVAEDFEKLAELLSNSFMNPVAYAIGVPKDVFHNEKDSKCLEGLSNAVAKARGKGSDQINFNDI